MAHLFRSRGLKRFDTIAIFMGNNARYHEIVWGAQRSGLRFVTASSKLSVSELEYILTDSEARMVFVSPELQPVLRQVAARLQWKSNIEFFMVMDKNPEFPYKALEPERNKFPTTPIADQSAGTPMLYSS
jgi:long-chain acyl-CoA synthetase